DQAENFRQLNAHVAQAQPTAAITDLINGWYNHQVHIPHVSFNADYIPTGWDQDAATRKLYNVVVKPYCRTCHVSQDIATLDWTKYDDFYNNRKDILRVACREHSMPHAEQTLKNFWTSPARAHLVGALHVNDDPKNPGKNPDNACKP